MMDMRKVKKVEHPLIAEWARKHWELENEIRKAVVKMSADELQALQHAATSLTSINCWFAEADVKPLVLEAIGIELTTRKNKAESTAAQSDEGEKHG